MKNKAIAFILTMLGMNATTACSQHNYENADVETFANLIQNPEVQLLDVRTVEEFSEGHLEGALNVDMKKDDFMEKVCSLMVKEKTIAVYCRSGRRSADVAEKLSSSGYRVVNLLGGILAWTAKQKPIVNDGAEMDVFQTKTGKTVTLYALMHASFRLVYEGMEIEIDPVCQLGDRKVDYSAMPKADFIFVTHEHGDHFDQKAINLLSREKTRLITNHRVGEQMGKGEMMQNGDKKDLVENISVEAVPAYNITEGHTQFHPKGRDNGYVLSLDGFRIYIAGDTEDIPEMESLKDIDIAFLPCNQPYTMTTEQLIKAARVIKPRVLFPYHYSKTDVSGLPSQLKADGIDVRIRHYE